VALDALKQDPDNPPLQPGDRVQQILPADGFQAVLCDKSGRVLRIPVPLFALIQRGDRQIVRGYLNPLQTAPIEEDDRWVGYWHVAFPAVAWREVRKDARRRSKRKP
jgi:hypothetical protein